LGAIAVGILYFWIPKTTTTLVISLGLIFFLLIHPLWNFWWVEKSRFRQITFVSFLLILLIALGFIAWPSGDVQQPASSAILRVADYERFPLVAGEKMKIHLHIRNSGLKTIPIYATYAPIFVEINGEIDQYQKDYDKRKVFEDSLWEKMLTSESKKPRKTLFIPPIMDYWLPLETADPLKIVQINGLTSGNMTVYFMGIVRDSNERVILEFCARTGPDCNTMLFCLGHNGP
ncbi:MAG: hypothetical protein AB1306_01400, partial [Nitrospirota bacterium]